MRHVLLILLHLLSKMCKLLRPGGAKSLVAENVLLKQQLLILRRSRRRAPNLRSVDRVLFGFCSQFLNPRRLLRTAIILKPATLYMANYYSSGDWQFKQPVAMALPTVILKASRLRCWAACFLPGRVAG